MDHEKATRKLWEHPDPKSTAMWTFMQDVNAKFGLSLNDFDSLYEWSCKNRADFYGFWWDLQRFIQEGSYTKVVDESVPINELPRWFEGLRLNWAENFLYKRGPDDGPGVRGKEFKDDNRVACTEIREGLSEVRDVTWGELRDRTGRLAAALKARGVGVGDRVVVVGANSVSTLAVCLATCWLGGLFSTSSTDMGVNGLLQRTVQINPKFVFFDDGALYNGKILDLTDKIKGVNEGLKQCSNFQNIVAIQRFDKPYNTSSIPGVVRLEDFLYTTPDLTIPEFVRVGFQDPFVVYYSSGTTGIPKAIVHAAGPLLLNGSKQSTLHRNESEDEVGLQYTTTGWIMYMSSIGLMMSGARAVLYDGSPFLPDKTILLRIIEQQKVTVLGISPRWIGEIMKAKISPREVADLSTLRGVVSTGMVLPDIMFDWFYDVGFPKHTHLCNIAGGTDVAGCFVMSNPLKPLYRGGFQGPCLGIPIAIYDSEQPEGSQGKEMPDGQPGDLVATAAFPNIPAYLWGDGDVAPGPKYQSSYFARFQNVWTQGDFIQKDPTSGRIEMLGRSDGVLNPSGIRFGSSDIYSVIEHNFPDTVADSLCVGQRRPQDTDERVVLFVIMKPGNRLDRKLVVKMKDNIAQALTKRHVPKYIFETPDIPTTVNGKKVELPVKKIISGQTIKPSGTLLNPQSLEYYYRFQKIEELEEPSAKL